MNDSSRTQGGLICVGAAIVGAWFLLGLLQKSYWAIALPVAAVDPTSPPNPTAPP